MSISPWIKTPIDWFFKVVFYLFYPFAMAFGWWRYRLPPFWKGVVAVLVILLLVAAILVGGGWFILSASYPQ